MAVKIQYTAGWETESAKYRKAVDSGTAKAPAPLVEIDWSHAVECGRIATATPSEIAWSKCKKAKRTGAKRATATKSGQRVENNGLRAELAEARAEIERLRAALGTVQTISEPEALPSNYAVVPWTREDGKQYRAIVRTNRKGFEKRFAVPVEYVGAVARALTA